MYDPYWPWWWTAIAAFLVLFLLCSVWRALAKQEGSKILAGFFHQHCRKGLAGFVGNYALAELANFALGPGLPSKAIDALLGFLAVFNFIIVPLSRIRIIPVDVLVRLFFKAPKMEVLQLSRSQERAVDTLVLAHLSDLHLTEDLTIEGGLSQQQVKKRAFEALKWALERSDFVIVTGDITDRGRRSEWDQFLAILEELKVPLASNKVLVVPGNHDLSMTTTETDAPQLAFEERAFTYVQRVLRNAPLAWMMVEDEGEYTSVRSFLDDKAWYFDLYEKQRPTAAWNGRVVFPEGLSALAPGYEGIGSRMARHHGPLHCADFLSMAYPMVMRDDDKCVVVALNSASFLAQSFFDGAVGELRQGQLDKLISLLERNREKCIIVLVHHHIGLPAQTHREYVNAYGRLQTRALTFRHARAVAKAISLFDNCYLFHGHIHYPFAAQVGRANVISGPSTIYTATTPQCFLYQIHPQDGIAILDEGSFAQAGLSGSA